MTVFRRQVVEYDFTARKIRAWFIDYMAFAETETYSAPSFVGNPEKNSLKSVDGGQDIWALSDLSADQVQDLALATRTIPELAAASIISID